MVDLSLSTIVFIHTNYHYQLEIYMFYYYLCHVLLCTDNLVLIILINIEFNGRAVPGPYFRPICSPAGKCRAEPWFRLAAGPASGRARF